MSGYSFSWNHVYWFCAYQKSVDSNRFWLIYIQNVVDTCVASMGGKTRVAQMNPKLLERSEQHDLQSSRYDPTPNPQSAESAKAGKSSNIWAQGPRPAEAGGAKTGKTVGQQIAPALS